MILFENNEMTKYCDEMKERNRQLSKNFKSFQDRYKEFKKTQLKKTHELEEKYHKVEDERKTCKIFHNINNERKTGKFYHIKKNEKKISSRKLNFKSKSNFDNEKDSIENYNGKKYNEKLMNAQNEIESMNKTMTHLRNEKFNQEEEIMELKNTNKILKDENKKMKYNIIVFIEDYFFFDK
jgi:hypothetical protein